MKKAERERVEAEGKVFVDPLVGDLRAYNIGCASHFPRLHFLHLRSLPHSLCEQ